MGSVRELHKAALVPHAEASGVEAGNFLVVAFEDKRVRDIDLEGSLGLNFFASYNWVANFHRSELLVSPRAADLGSTADARIARWGDMFAGCEHRGCVAIAPYTPLRTPLPTSDAAPAGEVAPLPQGFELTRDASAIDKGFEIWLEAEFAAGSALGGKPPLIAVVFRPGQRGTILRLENPLYGDAIGFRVVDASPYPKVCEMSEPCVIELPAIR